MLTATASRSAMLTGLEEVLVTSADDVCMHKAYASALIASCDPVNLARGRFIEAQLKLEGVGVKPEEKKKLQGRERKLLRDHGRSWLGALASFLLDRPGYRFTMARGWLASVEAPQLEADFIAVLARAPEARLLRRLVILQTEPAGVQALAPLTDASFIEGLRELEVVEQGSGEVPGAVLARLLGAADGVHEGD